MDFKNETLRRASRVLPQLEYSRGGYDFCQTTGADDHWCIVSFRPSNFVVNRFNGTKKKIVFDFSAILTEGMDVIGLEWLQLTFLHVVAANRVLGVGFDWAGIQVFCGTFDFNSCVLKFDNMCSLNGRWIRHYLMLDQTTQKYAVLWSPKGIHGLRYRAINTNGDQLSLDDAMAEVPGEISCPMVIDDKLYGFRCDGTVNTQQLSVFSLGSGLETVHELKTDGLKDGYVYRDSPHTWNANKLLVAKHDWITDTPTVMVFDLPTLKWKDTKLEFDGYIEDLLLIGNSLILRIWKRDEDGISKNWCYRFPFGRLDTLSNSIWHSIGHYSQFHPEFNRWMASKLPSRLRNYLPPWD